MHPIDSFVEHNTVPVPQGMAHRKIWAGRASTMGAQYSLNIANQIGGAGGRLG